MPPDVRYFKTGDLMDWKAWVAPLEWVCRKLNIAADFTCRGLVTHDLWNYVIYTVQRCASKTGVSRQLYAMVRKEYNDFVTTHDVNTISDNIAILIKGVYP